MNRDAMLAALKGNQPPTPVEIDGQTFHLRRMSGRDRDAMESESYMLQKEGKPVVENYKARVLARSLCDETGARVFTDEDIPTLGDCDAGPMSKLNDVAMKVNGLDKEAKEKAEGK